MTIVTMGDERVLEQIQKQLHKLVDVLKVCDLSEGEHIERRSPWSRHAPPVVPATS